MGGQAKQIMGVGAVGRFAEYGIQRRFGGIGAARLKMFGRQLQGVIGCQRSHLIDCV